MPYAINPRAQRIYYETHGSEGPVVVMLMGIGVSGRFWLTIPREVAGHSEQPYRVIVVDNRGTGFSDKPFTPWTMGHMADDVATVLDAVKVDRADVVGMSMGGMIAQHVALRHPDRVSGLVLMCTMPGMPFARLPRPSAVQMLVRGFANGLRGQEFMKLVYPESALERAMERIKKGIWREAVHAEQVEMRSVFYQLLAIAGHSTGHRLKHIKCPTVVVTGADDMLVPAANSHRMARRIPGAVLQEVNDCGHDMITLAPDAVYDALRQLRVLRGSASAA